MQTCGDRFWPFPLVNLMLNLIFVITLVSTINFAVSFLFFSYLLFVLFLLPFWTTAINSEDKKTKMKQKSS